MSPSISFPVTTADYRLRARGCLPNYLFEYIDGGANDERTLAASTEAFARVKLRQRVLCNVDHIDTSTTVAGERLAMPLVLAPVGMAGMFARRGELQAVRAAQAAGVNFTLSTVGICDLAEVRAAAAAPFWFQLYMIRDREFVRCILARAAEAGCTTLAFTVDLPMPGMRHRDMRNGMVVPGLAAKWARAKQLAVRPGWIWDVGVRGKPHDFGNLKEAVPGANDLAAYAAWVHKQFDPSVTWADIEWLRGIWKGRLLLKGILDVDDARSALNVGADGLIVSNHGGRQLDGVATSLDKLPAIADAVGDRIEVLMDGGVRSGLDVYRALALGARAVMIGRPWVWAMASRGEAGVSALLATYRQELRVAMALTGVNAISQIDRDSIDRG
jgi:L-lactate dehydrogenase (cytochrome)